MLACWNKKGRWWHLRPVSSKCSLQHVNPLLHQRLRISSSCLQKSQISIPYHLQTTAKRGFTQCCIDPDILYNGYFSKRHCPHRVIEEGNWRVLTLIDFFLFWFPKEMRFMQWNCLCLPAPFSSHPPNNFGAGRTITDKLDGGRRSQRYQIPALLRKAGSQTGEQVS